MKIYFIGIGGIGVSAVAQYFKAQGHFVCGSDLVESEITQMLRQKDIEVFIGQQDGNILKNAQPDVVLHTPAVNLDNFELIQAKALGIKTMSSPEFFGEFTKNHFTIAICGSHGKSTIASMVSLVLEKAGFDPTVILGTKLKEFGNSNFRAGKSKYLVIEADEYKRSFLNYWPSLVVLSNIEIDHLDYFKDLTDLQNAFKSFIDRLPQENYLVLNQSIDFDFNHQKKIVYSLNERLNLKVSGDYNQENANAVLCVAEILNIDKAIAIQALESYNGAWRRLEEKDVLIDGKNIKLISDYGHHPTQLLLTAQGLRNKFAKEYITLVYQPHQYQRTMFFEKEFIRTFQEISDKRLADKIIITDIYDVAGRENMEAKAKINASMLAQKVDRLNVLYCPENTLNSDLKTQMIDKQVLVIMGAGTFYTLK